MARLPFCSQTVISWVRYSTETVFVLPRYYVTNDGYLILSSEVGVLPVDESRIKLKDRLRPGKMLLVDTVKGELIDDDELKEKYATKQPLR